MTHKQAIIIRKDLNMRRGKEIAQGAHASLGAVLSICQHASNSLHAELDERIAPWLNGSFAKICLVVNSEEEMVALQQKAEKLGIINCLITDNGVTEFHGNPTITALAIGPDLRAKVDQVTSELKLY